MAHPAGHAHSPSEAQSVNPLVLHGSLEAEAEDGCVH